MNALRAPGEDADLIERLLDEPELHFALTSLLAFRLELWADAARAARFAADANTLAGNQGDPYRRNELLYMQSVAQRYRLADTESDPQRRTEPLWDRCLADATAALAETIASHKSKGEIPEYVRDLTELAAVKLSYAGWLTYPRASGAEASDLPVSADQALREAIDHLDDCRRIFEEREADQEAAAGSTADLGIEPRHRRMLECANRQAMTYRWAAALCSKAMERITGAAKVSVPWDETPAGDLSLPRAYRKPIISRRRETSSRSPEFTCAGSPSSSTERSSGSGGMTRSRRKTVQAHLRS